LGIAQLRLTAVVVQALPTAAAMVVACLMDETPFA